MKDEEYKLLKKISNKFDSVDALSIDELKALSDSKDLLVKAQLKLYGIEKGVSKARKHKIVNVKKNLGGDNRIL